MAQSAGMKRKTELLDIINEWIDRASNTKKGFTPEVVSGFYKEGLKARESKEVPAKRLVEARPIRQMPVAVRTEKPPQSERRALTKEMTASVDLAERLELASRGKKLNLREWAAG
ncbi:MAG: hypothetical protein V1827_04650 [Candidatus Micrarchaeota archaeon]